MSLPFRGYADRPIVKAAVWTWEVPVYFFVGGSAGMAGLIAGVVFLFADARGELDAATPLVSRALWVAFAGAVLSPALLISDLGRPRRFLNMLRRFNRRSALSVGVWILIVFSGAVTAALWLHGSRQAWGPWPPAPASFQSLRGAVMAIVTVFGGLLATYTGVLLAATVVPAWNRHRATLPLHFGLASLGAAAAWLVLLGVDSVHTLRVLVVAVVLDGLLEAGMRVAPSATSGQNARVALQATAPAALAVACLALGFPLLGAAVVLVAGLAGRFHWVGEGRAVGWRGAHRAAPPHSPRARRPKM